MTEARCLRRREVRGSRRSAWTAYQQQVFDSPYRLTVAWGPNGIGKSLAIAELTRRALGCELAWQEPGPQVVLLVGNTWMQLSQTVDYLWESVDKRWFKKSIRFEAGQMKGQRMPVFDILEGPGKGGKLILAIFDARNLAGPRANVVITDEPLPEKVHNELWPRLLGRDGRMYQTFTPTLGTAADLEYLWQMVDNPGLPWAGQIHTTLTLAAVTPISVTGIPHPPWMTQREIDQFEAGLSEMERDMRMGRSREPRRGAAYFSAWGPHLMRDDTPPPGTPVGIGIDHGSKPGAQRAVLVAVAGHGIWARVWVLDEYRGDGRTESEDDARGILDMLERNELRLEDVDKWVGDRAHHGDRRGGKKSNTRLKMALAKASGIDVRRSGWMPKLPKPLRRMWTPKKFEGSVWEGCEVLHRLMVGNEPRLSVATRCTYLDDDLREWEGRSADPHKDGIDAFRYIVVPMVEGKRRS